MSEQSVSTATLKRLPLYLSYLKGLDRDSPANISSGAISEALHLNEIQVRKDLASISRSGRPKIGYIVEDLVGDLEDYLGYNDVNDAILVGAGKLGKALLDYKGFYEYGLRILAAFDSDPGVVDELRRVYPLDKLPGLCQRMHIRIGVISTPAHCAQEVCDILTENGVRAIWNFAPAHLTVPEGVILQNENLAVSFVVLSKRLQEAILDDR